MKTRDIVKEAVQKLGYTELRKPQIQPINDLMDGKDILLIAPTSMGKSAVFQVPGLAQAKQKPGSWVLIIEPTLALIHDQVRRLREKSISAACLTGENAGCSRPRNSFRATGSRPCWFRIIIPGWSSWMRPTALPIGDLSTFGQLTGVLVR